MSVPVGKRSHGVLEVNIAALELCKYTLEITSNPNVFVTDQISFTEKIRNTVIDIHLLCWEANNIRVSDKLDLYESRLEKQNEALSLCDRLCALIEIAHSLFHLSSKRTEYWMGKVLELRSIIRAWRDSNREKLKPVS